MAKKQKTEVRSQESEEGSAGAVGPEETLEISIVREGCPTYIVSADTGFGMLAMLAIYRLAQAWAGPEELRREVAGVMRTFEQWEEAHRGDPHA
jgi:hypothetical protein